MREEVEGREAKGVRERGSGGWRGCGTVLYCAVLCRAGLMGVVRMCG